MVVVAMNFQTGEGMGSSRRRPLALSCRTDGPNNNQINAELNVSTRGANPRNRGGVNHCRAKQPGGGQPRQEARDLPSTEGRIALPRLCERRQLARRSDEHRDTRLMETQSEASAGAAQADRRQPAPPAPGATAFKCGRPVTLLHQTGQGKSTVAQIHADGATPPADRPQWEVRDNGDGAQSGVSLARARALVAPPSLCIFHTAIFRRRMVLARVQD